MDLKSTYNKIADDWFKDHKEDTKWIPGADKFLSYLPKGGTILDVGCAAGAKTKYLIQKGFKVTGVDFSEKMIELARKNVPEGEFEVEDLYELDNFKRTFDGIFALGVLLHVPKKRMVEVIEKIGRKLKDGGYLYLGVKEARPEKAKEAMIKENDYGYEYERFFSFFTAEELKKYCEEAQLEVVWEGSFISTSGDTKWLQVIVKKSFTS